MEDVTSRLLRTVNIREDRRSPGSLGRSDKEMVDGIQYEWQGTYLEVRDQPLLT